MIKEAIKQLREKKDNSISYIGDYLTVSIEKYPENKLMRFIAKGDKSLPKLKSLDELLDEYREEDHNIIIKYYEKLEKKYEKELEKITKDYEKKLNNLIDSFEKDISKIEG
jgi:hypothetical protein